MRYIVLIFFLYVVVHIGSAQSLYWINTEGGDWEDGSNWSTLSGGAPCNCVPTSTSNVNFLNADGNCTINEDVNVQRIVMADGYDGTLTINSSTFQARSGSFTNPRINGEGTKFVFESNSGSPSLSITKVGTEVSYIRIQQLTVNLDVDGANFTINGPVEISVLDMMEVYLRAAGHSTFNSRNATIRADNGISVMASNLYIVGSVYQSSLSTFTKSVGGYAGGNITDSGANIWGGNTFDSDVHIKNTTSGCIYLAAAGDDVFHGKTTLGCTISSGSIRVGNTNRQCSFKGNLVCSASQNITLNPMRGIVLGFNGGTVLFDGNETQSIKIDHSSNGYPAEPIFHNVIVNKNSSKLHLDSKVVVTGQLQLDQGVMVASKDANRIEFLDNSTVTVNPNRRSYIEGRVFKTGNDQFTFPVGSGGLYRPIHISAPANTTTTFSAIYANEDPGNASKLDETLSLVSGFEFWELLNATLKEEFVTVTLSWDEDIIPDPPGKDYVTNPAALKVVRWNTTTGRWTDLGNEKYINDPNIGTVSSLGPVNIFGVFSLGTAPATDDFTNTLPVILGKFEGMIENNGIRLSWNTLEEINNNYFEIERSSDGMDFKKISRISSTGDMSAHYEFLDTNPIAGRSYYRLKQVDFDGHEQSLSVISMVNAIANNETVNVYPNPVHGQYLFLSRKTWASITDQFGRVLIDKQFSDKLDVGCLSAGTYILNCGANTRTIVIEQ